MDRRADIIAGAVEAFETDGFRGIGVDKLLTSSGASTRTLYKHFGSKDGLVLAVLEERHRRFCVLLEAVPQDSDPIAALFDTLRAWLEEHGARGCMLLRARSEYSDANQEIVGLVRRQKEEFHRIIQARVEAVLGWREDKVGTQVWLLFEGATAAASVADLTVVDDAKAAAMALVGAMKTGSH
jgi:AcrR family transcriptional regulator